MVLIPERLRVRGPSIVDRLPVELDLAASRAIAPLRIFISVDLPAPFSPSRTCTSPLRTSRSTPSSATTPGNVLRMPRMRSAGGAAPASSCCFTPSPPRPHRRHGRRRRPPRAGSYPLRAEVARFGNLSAVRPIRRDQGPWICWGLENERLARGAAAIVPPAAGRGGGGSRRNERRTHAHHGGANHRSMASSPRVVAGARSCSRPPCSGEASSLRAVPRPIPAGGPDAGANPAR